MSNSSFIEHKKKNCIDNNVFFEFNTRKIDSKKYILSGFYIYEGIFFLEICICRSNKALITNKQFKILSDIYIVFILCLKHRLYFKGKQKYSITWWLNKCIYIFNKKSFLNYFVTKRRFYLKKNCIMIGLF